MCVNLEVTACCSVQLDYKVGVDCFPLWLDCIQYLKRTSLALLLIFWPIYRYIFFPSFKLVVLYLAACSLSRFLFFISLGLFGDRRLDHVSESHIAGGWENV